MPTEKCKWELDTDDCYYETDCGNAFTLLEGNLDENGFLYCPYCGKRTDEGNDDD